MDSIRRTVCLLIVPVMLAIAFCSALSENNDYTQRVREIAALCELSVCSDEYAQALWLHDNLINTCVYQFIDTSANPEDVFLNNKGSARQYAAAYKLLLNELGILCEVVSGEADYGSGYCDHTWNIAYLNGDWYHIDCALDEKFDGKAKHEYFGLNDIQMSKNHKWRADTEKANAEPTEASCNFFLRSGYIPISNISELEAVLAECILAERKYIPLYYVGGNRAFKIGDAVCDILNDISNDIIYETINPNAEIGTCEIILNYGAGFPETDKSQVFRFHNDNITLQAGDELKLIFTSLPESAGLNGVWFESDNSWIADIVSGRLKAYTPGTTSIRALLNNSECDELTVTVYAENALIFPEGLNEISDEAYMNCASIEHVYLPNGTTSIGSKAFSACTSLKTIAIPNSVSYIAADAFENVGDFTVICVSDGYPHQYAAANGYNTQILY